MTDYIKREDAIEAVMNTECVFAEDGTTYQKTIDVVRGLNNIDRADAVEVVRCKECKYKRDSLGNCGRIPWREVHLGEDGFCSCGERKDND